MRTIAILPIKSFGLAKQRLAGALGAGARQALVQAMFQDVLAALRRVEGLDAIVVVTANPTAARAARVQDVPVLHDPHETGHCEAALIGIDHALRAGFERALVVPGDTPLLDPDEVGALLGEAAADGTGLVIVPDRHGNGTNALLLRPPTAIAPSFGPDSRERHRLLAAAGGVSCRVADLPSLAMDLDTPEDLAVLSDRLARTRSTAPLTRGALSQLDRARPSASAAAS